MTTLEKMDMLVGCATILNHYGIRHQCTRASEKAAELIIELSRFINNEEHYESIKVVEAIADVEVMLDQIKLFFEMESAQDIDDIKSYIISREQERIPEEPKCEKVSIFNDINEEIASVEIELPEEATL